MTPETETSAPETPRVSVVIVSLNRGESLRRSLQALGETHQIVVVDNGSIDGSAHLDLEFPNARFHRLPKNFGLTRALNIGLRATEGEFILCLHDDARISGDDVSLLADYLEQHPEVGAVAPLLVNEDDVPSPQVRALPTPSDPDPAFAAASAPATESDELAVECVSGAAIMFRAFFLRALRHIDERYGNYGSDIEICAQVRRSGKKIVILRNTAAVHGSEPSPADSGRLSGDRAAGTAAFLGKHHGFASSLLYRVKSLLMALLTFRFHVLMGVLGAEKIDGGA